jgi:hypothetical protein
VFFAYRSYDPSYAIGNRGCLLPIAVSMPGFDAHCGYAVRNRECLLYIAVTQLGIESGCCLLQSVCLILTLAFVSYFRLLYSLCLLLHTAIQEPGFDAYRSGFRGSLLHVVVQDA